MASQPIQVEHAFVEIIADASKPIQAHHGFLEIINDGTMPVQVHHGFLEIICLRHGKMPPVRILQRSDSNGTIGQQQSIQKTQRINGPGAIY